MTAYEERCDREDEGDRLARLGETITVSTADLRAILDYAQPDEEHDMANLEPGNSAEDHIVYAMRRLRRDLDILAGELEGEYVGEHTEDISYKFEGKNA